MKTSLSRELLIGSAVIIISIAVLPGLIYLVGSKMFGAYGIAGGMPSMYQAVLADLATPTVAAWTIALCPAVCVVLLRLIFLASQNHALGEETGAPTTRREPTISG